MPNDFDNLERELRYYLRIPEKNRRQNDLKTKGHGAHLSRDGKTEI